MCCDWIENEPEVGECPDCGAPVDADGDVVGYCGYSTVICPTCGDAPCDDSC